MEFIFEFVSIPQGSDFNEDIVFKLCPKLFRFQSHKGLILTSSAFVPAVIENGVSIPQGSDFNSSRTRASPKTLTVSIPQGSDFN